MNYHTPIIAEFQKIYDRLGIQLQERGESFYQDLMKVTVDILDKGGKAFVFVIITMLP